MRRKNHSRVWEEIGSVIRQNKGRAILLVICMTASVILALIPPQILRYVVDDKLIPGRQQGLFVLAVLYVAASVLGAAAEFGKGIMLTVIGEKYIHRIRTDLMEKPVPEDDPWCAGEKLVSDGANEYSADGFD